MKSERTLGVPSSRLLVWWTAIRPRTLSMAATPVLLGSALAGLRVLRRCGRCLW